MIYLVHKFDVSVKNDLDDLDRDLSYCRCESYRCKRCAEFVQCT